MTAMFRIRETAVASEIIDGEAIIMQLRTGHYFSARGTGAAIWAMFTQGVDLQTASGLIADATGTPVEVVRAAVREFAAEAEGHSLGAMEDVVAEAAHDALPVAVPAIPSSWAPPVLEVFTDMQDLLLLDPIHDVSDEAGWPMQKPVV